MVLIIGSLCIKLIYTYSIFIFIPLADSAVKGTNYTYKVFNEHKTWEASRDDCDARGGRLARMMNSTEKDAASQVIPSSSKKYWMGLWSTANKYKWSNGSHINEHNPQFRKIVNFDNGPGTHCYAIEKGKTMLNSVFCKESHAYLCQVFDSQGENVRTRAGSSQA